MTDRNTPNLGQQTTEFIHSRLAQFTAETFFSEMRRLSNEGNEGNDSFVLDPDNSAFLFTPNGFFGIQLHDIDGNGTPEYASLIEKIDGSNRYVDATNADFSRDNPYEMAIPFNFIEEEAAKYRITLVTETPQFDFEAKLREFRENHSFHDTGHHINPTYGLSEARVFAQIRTLALKGEIPHEAAAEFTALLEQLGDRETVFNDKDMAALQNFEQKAGLTLTP